MGAPAAHLIAPGVWRIPVAPADGINAFAVVGDDGAVTLVDAGMPWAWKRLEAGLAAAGTAPSEVTRIAVTHAHSDHVGNAARVAELSRALVHAHADDVPFLERGSSPPIDPSRRFRRLLDLWGRFPALEVSEAFADGDVIPGSSGLRAHHTPGHTPGHTSFVHEPTGVLITGDVVHFWRGDIRIGMKLYCHDIALNERSAQRLAELAGPVVAFTHGPHLDTDGRARVHAFLARRATVAS